MKFLKYILIASSVFAIESESVIKVLPAVNKNISADAITIFNQRLVHEYVKLKEFTIITDEAIDFAIDEQVKQQSGCTDTKCLVELGVMAGAQYVIHPEVVKIYGIYYINIELISVEKSIILTSANRASNSEWAKVIDEDLPDIIQEVMYNNIIKRRKKKQNYISYDNVSIDTAEVNIKIGGTYLTGDDQGYGLILGFTFRHDASLGINYNLIFKNKYSADLSSYFTYSSYDTNYTKDYTIEYNVMNNFYLNVGWDYLSVVGGVSLDTYITSNETDLWSDQGDYGYSEANDNSFTSVGYIIGLEGSFKIRNIYYNILGMYTHNNTDNNYIIGISLEI